MAKISINDIEFDLVRCEHCGQQPTEREALEAVARYERIMGIQTCVCCGERIKPHRYELIHTLIDEEKADGASWYASPDPTEDALVVRPIRPRVAVAAHLHRGCAQRVLPFLPEEVLECSEAIWPQPDVGPKM